MIEIFDNYLSEKIFTEVVNYTTNKNLCWNFSDRANPAAKTDEQCQFFHHMFENGKQFVEGSDIFSKKILHPLMLKKQRNLLLLRSRINFFIKIKDYQYGLGYHIDIDDFPGKCYTLLLYLEDSNGCTEFEECGTRVESKRNRACVFPCNLRHQTVTSTNTLFRRNINLNFIYQKNNYGTKGLAQFYQSDKETSD